MYTDDVILENAKNIWNVGFLGVPMLPSGFDTLSGGILFDFDLKKLWFGLWGAEHPTHPYFSAISDGAAEAILKLLSNNHLSWYSSSLLLN
ncbi:MAG: hypothetical protein H8E28_16705 [Anaerolineae bacterium]|nr:hypothetical protein [Anaerolineae bacterium]